MPVAVAGRSDLAQQALLYHLAAYTVTSLAPSPSSDGGYAWLAAAHTVVSVDRAARAVAYIATEVSLGLGLAGGPVLAALRPDGHPARAGARQHAAGQMTPTKQASTNQAPTERGTLTPERWVAPLSALT